MDGIAFGTHSENKENCSKKTGRVRGWAKMKDKGRKKAIWWPSYFFQKNENLVTLAIILKAQEGGSGKSFAASLLTAAHSSQYNDVR